ncbi:uncharacterized protein LOC144112423 [Amblyomma americanum]|uniref:Uncharacterized protein n=1 Tax=Amblyomma americanum TaxID=6943 RepID=A0AAQ4DS74_AMBAM
MDNAERLGDANSTPAALPEHKDDAALAEQPPSLEAAGAIDSGDCNADCSPSIQRAVTSPLVDLFKDDSSGRHLAINGNNKPSEAQSDRSNPCTVEPTLLETCMVPANGDVKNGPRKIIMSAELHVCGAGSAKEESQPKGACLFSRPEAPGGRIAFHADESPDTVMRNQFSCDSDLGSSNPFKGDVLNITPSGSDKLEAVNDDAAKSPVTGNAVAKVPPLRSVRPAAGDKLTKAGAPAGSSRNCSQLAMDEMACVSDQLLLVDTCTQAPVEKNLPAEQNKGNEVKQKPSTVCPKLSLCGLQPEELRRKTYQLLRRQRDEAYDHVGRLEKEIALLQKFYDRHCEFLLNKLRKLEGENRRLSAANAVQRRLMQELLPRLGDSSLPGTVSDQLKLQGEGGAKPPLHSVTPAGGDELIKAGSPAGSSHNSRQLAVGEMACLSDKLLPVDSGTPASVQENLHAEHNNGKNVKQKPGVVCPNLSLCAQPAEELRRQRAQAYDRVERLEKEIVLLRNFYDRHSEFLLNKVRKLNEKNRTLSATNAEQRLLMQELLSRRGNSSLPDAIREQEELQAEVKRLRKQILLREEELQDLKANFLRMRKASTENYRAATHDINKVDTMLQRVHEAFEAAFDDVCRSPALKQLLLNLRSGGGGWKDTTPSSK